MTGLNFTRKGVYSLSSIVFSCLMLLQCSKERLNREEVMRLLQEAKVYPKVVDHRVFCGETETAKKIHDAGLEQEGLVTVQLLHTSSDVGKPLVSFTEKSEPYLLTTSDTARSLDIQNVKLADEELLDITDIQISEDGRKAVVKYTTTMKNLTPFVVLLQRELEKNQTRETYFSLTESGWHWDNKIVKIQSGQQEVN
jgi:hypothetical protein